MIINHYNEKRAAQAAAKFAELEGGTIDKYKLAKLMYYLERQTIVTTGQPLFHAELCSIPYGPIASEVNDGLNSIIPPNTIDLNTEEGFHPSWEQNFSRQGKNGIHRTNNPGDDELSDSDINLIQEIQSYFQNWGFTRLRNFFHALPEYEETDGKEPIHFTTILRVSGFSDEEIQELEKEYYYYLGLAIA